jgi:hypothetical protein
MGDHAVKQQPDATSADKPPSDDISKAALPEVAQEPSLAPLAEVPERGTGPSQDDSDKWEELCIGFWKQTKTKRKNQEPGQCYGISITLHKQ